MWQTNVICTVTLCQLLLNFEDPWWPLKIIWILIKPHKMWGLIRGPVFLTLRLYISKIQDRDNDFFFKIRFNKTQFSMQRVNKMEEPKQIFIPSRVNTHLDDHHIPCIILPSMILFHLTSFLPWTDLSVNSISLLSVPVEDTVGKGR